MFLRQILSCYNLKNFFSKLVKVLKLFYDTRTRVHFSISVLVLVLVLILEVFCGTRTRTRKLSTRLHYCLKANLFFLTLSILLSCNDNLVEDNDV